MKVACPKVTFTLKAILKTSTSLKLLLDSHNSTLNKSMII